MRHEESVRAETLSATWLFAKKTKTWNNGDNCTCRWCSRLRPSNWEVFTSRTRLDGQWDTDLYRVGRKTSLFKRLSQCRQTRYDHVDGTNDLESKPGLARNTAFRVESREYHHATPVAGTRSMEERCSRETPKEKEEGEDDGSYLAIGSSIFKRDTRRRTEYIDVLGLRSMSGERKFSGLDERNNCQGCPGNGTTLDVASVERHGVIRSPIYDDRFSTHQHLDNTAFNDDDDDEDDGDNGDDDYNNNDADDRDDRDDRREDRGEFLRREKNPQEIGIDETRRTIVVAGTRRPDDAKRKRVSREPRLLKRARKIGTEEKSEEDRDREIVETNACVDVPGGRLFDVNGRSVDDRTSSTDDETRGTYDTKKSARYDDREKWRPRRRRRRRKITDEKRKYADGFSLLRQCRDEDRDDKRNGFTARSGDTIVGIDDNDGTENCSSCDCDENVAKTEEEEEQSIPGVFVDVERRGRRKRRRPPRGRRVTTLRKNEDSCSRKKWTGVGNYGLLFVLYLLALPILCSTVSSGPVASAFAQKSPLTHGDNFTARNSSLQHQGHQVRRDSLLGHDTSHPYNEYTWEVNQINPWLSACDLAGPAPADLQGSCGPPEVPKNCPIPCSSKSQGDGNRAFHEVIEMLGVHERARSGAGGSRWRPAGTSTNNMITNKDDDGNKRTVVASLAPEQCLFYLEASHKRDICRDNFGRGSSLSFSNQRDNRYWFASGLRLRHCCEHSVVNALAPGKGGPLEDVLNGGRKCSEALDKLLLVDALAARLHCEFEEVLARYDCAQPYSVIYNCTHCKEAYRKWVCSSLVPYFAHGGPPASETSANAWSGLRLRPCRSFCQSVEQRCPYLLPGDRAPAYPTQYAGEPTFLCRDPNIPETGEQATRALHGNEHDECCFHVCSEDGPGSGVCANCTDREPHSHRTDHDIPTAPHCEITTTSSIQSGSTGNTNADTRDINGMSRDSSSESSSPSPSPSTTTSASFCGGGGVGSMPSSSGQSTTQTPPPSSISLICLFWVWAALISLCTGQTIFPWAPPSSLLMLDYPTAGKTLSPIGSASGIKNRKKNPRMVGMFSSDKGIGVFAATWWSLSSSAGSSSSSSSSSSSWPRIRESVLRLARVFLVSLSKMINDLHRRIVNFFLIPLNTLIRYLDGCRRRWYVQWWKWTHISLELSRSYGRKLGTVILSEAIFVMGESSYVGKRRFDALGKNVPRPPRGRRRVGRRRRRKRRRRRRRRRRHRGVVPIALITIRYLLRRVSIVLTMRSVDNAAPRLPSNRPYYSHYYDFYCYYHYYYYYNYYNYYYYYHCVGASTWWWWWLWRWWSWSRRSNSYRSKRHSYSYRKWKGPS